MKTFTNLLLLSFLLVLLIAPAATSHLLVSGPVPLGTVAGTRTAAVTKDDVTILPNLSDFNGNVDFTPQGLSDGIYRDTVMLTVYPRHIASYNELYRIYNNSGRTLRLKLETGPPTGNTYAYQALEAQLSDEILDPNQKAVVNVTITGDPAVAEYLSNTRIHLPLTIKVTRLD